MRQCVYELWVDDEIKVICLFNMKKRRIRNYVEIVLCCHTRSSGGVEAAVASMTFRSSSIQSFRPVGFTYRRLPSLCLACLLGLRRGDIGDFEALLALILAARRITVFSIVTSANIDIMPWRTPRMCAGYQCWTIILIWLDCILCDPVRGHEYST